VILIVHEMKRLARNAAELMTLSTHLQGGGVQLSKPPHAATTAAGADVTYYTAPSGAGVFSAGTQWWICGVDPGLHKARCRRTRRRAHDQRQHHPPPRRLRPGPSRRAASGSGQPATAPHPRCSAPIPAALPNALVPN